jgi:DNA-binding response OmpR family regulator
MERKRILVVEDEQELVIAVKIRLEEAGYETITAYDGMEALEKAKSQNPDLIILDLMLPKLDGYKVCKMLKFDERYKKIPIIMFTARAQKMDEELGREVGADAHIIKPFDHQILLENIKRLLNQ